LSAIDWAQRKAQEEPEDAELPDDIKDSIAKWDRVVQELSLLYELWAAGGHDCEDQVENLMQAYDDWLG